MTKDSFSPPRSVSLSAATSLTALSVQPATAWAGHSCSFLCSSQRRQIQISCYFSQVIQAEHIVISDLKTHLPKCQENLILKPSLYLFCYMYNSFRHKLNSFRQRFIQLLTSHVTSGHLRSQHCSRQGILCSMTSNCILFIVSQIATDSLSALVKETELLQNPSNGNCNHLPSQDHFDQRYALRSRSVNPQQKDQAEELFPSTIEVGFQLECSLQMFYLSIHRSVAQSNLPTFCETATSRTDQVFACILYII